MTERTKGRLSYSWMWVWLLIVAAVSAYVYIQAFDLATAILSSDFPTLSSALKSKEGSWIAESFKWIGGALFCWRIVKVVVLHGAPFSFGMRLSSGREDNGVAGRVVFRSHIGDHNAYSNNFSGGFWFAAIFRAHPRSDKLMRSRLEFLIATLPFGCSVVVEESRVFLLEQDHKQRATHYRSRHDKYSKMEGTMTPDRFRRDMVRNVKAISDYFKEQQVVKRIDGLNWHAFQGESCYITDDFGYRMSYSAVEGGKFKVGGLGDDGKGEIIVSSISGVRDLAKSKLHPVPEVS